MCTLCLSGTRKLHSPTGSSADRLQSRAEAARVPLRAPPSPGAESGGSRTAWEVARAGLRKSSSASGSIMYMHCEAGFKQIKRQALAIYKLARPRFSAYFSFSEVLLAVPWFFPLSGSGALHSGREPLHSGRLLYTSASPHCRRQQRGHVRHQIWLECMLRFALHEFSEAQNDAWSHPRSIQEGAWTVGHPARSRGCSRPRRCAELP